MEGRQSNPRKALPTSCDVLVAGSGNAGFAAALAAAQAGAARVLLIDKCPEDWVGGNTYFTAGAYRVAHGGLQDLLPIVNNVSEEQAAKIELSAYTESDFHADLAKVCDGQSDPELANILVSESNQTVKWLAQNGVRFQLSFNRQAYEVDGKIKFWGGLSLKTQDGGKGLISDYLKAAGNNGIETSWSTALVNILPPQQQEDDVIAIVKKNGSDVSIRARAVILAAGGFESNPRMRSRFLGAGWDAAMIRGTPHNTGDCLEMAMANLDAKAYGDWTGCHAVAWDADANPHSGDRVASNEFTKSGYPLGLMLNIEGKRFVDEGLDLRNYTYAKFGRAILGQPDKVAFQVWDSQASSMLRPEEYRPERVKRIVASTIEDLATQCAALGLQDREQFIKTIREYNEAAYANRQENSSCPKKWDPAIKDGVSTISSIKILDPPKTNWALPLDQGPYLAVKVTCGITFTFGGLKVNPETAELVASKTAEPIPGVYCCGEMLGGLFYQNYPGGSGLTSGAVFGRRAGTSAAKRAKS